MKKKLIIYILINSITLCVNLRLNAQITPLADNNWKLISSKSDDFDGVYLNLNKWEYKHPGDGYCFNWGGACYVDRDSNVAIDSGKLVLKMDKTGSTVYCGGIVNKNHDYIYKYGYYEIYAKLPGWLDGTTPKGTGLEFTLWTYKEDLGSGYCYNSNPPYNPLYSCNLVHDELDIVECTNYTDADVFTSSFHTADNNCCSHQYHLHTYENTEPLFENYHKYAMECLPDRAIFYFDDVPYEESYFETSTYISNSMFLIIDFVRNCNYSLDPGMTFPQNMYVDYFYYYEFDFDCDNDLTILTNQQLSTFAADPAVKKNISIGDGSSTIYLNSGDAITLRSANDVIINGDFTVPLGAIFNIIPTVCY